LTEGLSRPLPALPSGAGKRNRRKDGGFRVRTDRDERTCPAGQQGLPSPRAVPRDRFGEDGLCGRTAARQRPWRLRPPVYDRDHNRREAVRDGYHLRV